MNEVREGERKKTIEFENVREFELRSIQVVWNRINCRRENIDLKHTTMAWTANHIDFDLLREIQSRSHNINRIQH